MKHNWEYKKLGDICDVLDAQRKPVSKAERKNGIYPYYGASGIQDYVDSYLFDGRYLLVGEDGAKWTSNERSAYIVSGKCWVNNHAHILQMKNDIVDSFVEFYLCHHDLSSYITGAVVPKLTQQALKSIPIPLPPLSTQQSIVSELDSLSKIIADCKETLKDYDALEQSIFYDMFGDPVKNEKGWEVKKLGEIGNLARGVSKHRPRNAPELLGGTMPLIQTGDVANADFFIEKYTNTYSELGVAQSKVWKKGTLCITIAATIGKCAILNFDACFPDSVVGFEPNNEISEKIYILFLFKNLQKILEEEAPAVAQKNINLALLNNLTVPLPPLPLQQQFASKIEAIEQMKEETKKALQEAETLFQARMDYWFN